MSKVDFKKQLKHLYLPSSKKIAQIDVSKMNFIMVQGKGAPGDELFTQKVEALYALAFTIRMMPKAGFTPSGYFEYVVPPLEGLWWLENNTQDIVEIINNKDKWQWQLMIMQPKFVDDKLISTAKEMVLKKKKEIDIDDIDFKPYDEGLCVQTMHIGPYSEEPATLRKMKDFIELNNLIEHGYHHEIYLSDPRRTAPEKLKTVLRQAVKEK